MITTLISCILALFILLNRGVSLEQEERELTYEESIIYRYFHLLKRIGQINRRYHYALEEFKHRSFTPWIEHSELGVVNVGVRVESIVVEHVFHLQMLELKIDILNFKSKHFQRYLKRVDNLSHQYLFEKYYSKRSVLKCEQFLESEKSMFEEIREIEEAAAFHFGYEFERDTSEMTEEEIEDDFNKMLEMIGV